MKVHIENQRKDGKLTVRYSFDNGVSFRKVRTVADVHEDAVKADSVSGASWYLEQIVDDIREAKIRQQSKYA